GGGWVGGIEAVERGGARSCWSSREMTVGRANGGIWASGGPSVDVDGSVWAVTGNSPRDLLDRTWGQSVLRWGPGVPLKLTGTYTPWNHCQLDGGDIDLCGSGVTLLPQGRGTGTP